MPRRACEPLLSSHPRPFAPRSHTMRLSHLLPAACIALAPLPAPAQQTAAADSLPLVPLPREAVARPALRLDRGVAVLVPGGNVDDRFAASELVAALRERGVRAAVGGSAGVQVTLLRRGDAAARALLERQ